VKKIIQTQRDLPPLPVTPFSREGLSVLKKDGKLGRSDAQVIAPYQLSASGLLNEVKNGLGVIKLKTLRAQSSDYDRS
jgi:hypothetical protein